MIALTSHVFVLEGEPVRPDPKTKPAFDLVLLDHPTIERLFEADETRATLHGLQEKGLIGIAFMDSDRWVAYGWISRPGQPGPNHLPRAIRQQGLPWIQQCHTRAEYRNQGCYHAILLNLIGATREMDPDIAIGIDTGRRNLPAQRAIARIGFQPAGIAWSFRVPKTGDRWLAAIWLKNADHARSRE